MFIDNSIIGSFDLGLGQRAFYLDGNAIVAGNVHRLIGLGVLDGAIGEDSGPGPGLNGAD